MDTGGEAHQPLPAPHNDPLLLPINDFCTRFIYKIIFLPRHNRTIFIDHALESPSAIPYTMDGFAFIRI